MTKTEILNADFLDILFENRNKAYGAYELRKFYNRRLSLALLLTSILAYLLSFLVTGMGNRIYRDHVTKHDSVVLRYHELPKDKPKAKPLPATTQHRNLTPPQGALNNLRFVDQTRTIDIPEQLAGSVAGNNPDIFTPPDVPPLPSLGSGVDTVAIEPEPETVVPDQQPEFPGGRAAWFEFLQRHLQSPTALEPDEKIIVQVQFIVGVDGTVTQFNVIRSGGKLFDKEVMRVMSKMPKWTPARYRGKNVESVFVQPVTFIGTED